MKKTVSVLSLLLVALMLIPSFMRAQEMPQIPPIGLDPEVRIGTLPNGLTYYIRHNEYPKGQADFYIAQKVGSVLEEDNQRGLAHFLEHMCFNGTTHFPGKNIINWLETVGVKFGRNLNAYTSVDQTVYNISNVPVAREGVQDSCLLILHDWANDLLLLPEEIDAERAVIHEEWRQSNVGTMRILENLLPKIYPGERYGQRLPIGTMEVVDNFPYQALRDYYEKWYRPDQQGVIVVGDIDVDRIESKIKEMFSDIEMPKNPAERVYFPVADTKGTIYAIGHDKEQTTYDVELMFKTEALPREFNNTQIYYQVSYIKRVINMMLNARLDEIASKPDAPFSQAGTYFGDFFLAKTKNMFDVSVSAHSTEQLPSALAAAYREVLRAVRGGFTVSEYERAKAEIISQYESSYNNRNTRENNVFVQSYVNNFLDNKPIPTKEEEFNTMKQIAEMIPVQAINQAFPQFITADNRVLLALMPDNADGVYPTEEQFASALSAVDAETIEPYKEELKAEPLIPEMPKPGKITGESHSDQWDATVWTLSNGATVIVKPTKFKDDEILFSASALNGTADYGKEYYNSLSFMPMVMREGGLGTYTNSDLQKYLQGKQVYVYPNYSFYTRSLSGSSTPKDLSTLMELIYMNFTAPNITEDEFAALQKRMVAALHNQENDPQYIYSKRVMESLYKTPRIRQIDVQTVEGAKREQIIEIAKAMTTNAADFTFTFVGNVQIDSLRPLVEQYIASLPSDPKNATKKLDKFDPQFDMVGGTKTDTYTTKMQTPQTWVYLTLFGNEPYNMKNSQLNNISAQILSKRLLDKVREEMGAVYSISAQGGMDRVGNMNSEILSGFPMKPELKEETLKAIHDMIWDMTTNVGQEELDKVKEYMVKNYTEGREKNNSWLSSINGWLTNGVDTFNGNIESVNAITVDDIKNFMKSLISQGNYRVVILDPENAPAAE